MRQVARTVERAGEIEAEQTRAAVGAQSLRREQGRKQDERAAGEEPVVAERDEVVLGDGIREPGDGQRDEGGDERDRERDRRQHLVSPAASEAEDAFRGEDPECQDRGRRPPAWAVVGAVAEVEELSLAPCGHASTPR